MSNISISGIPSKAGPFPGTTKNLYSFYLYLCIFYTFILHTPILGMLVLLNSLKIVLLSLCFAHCSTVALGK